MSTKFLRISNEEILSILLGNHIFRTLLLQSDATRLYKCVYSFKVD